MPKKNTTKVMVFGTFDGLHPGHLNFFKQARSLPKGEAFLIVSVARDSNVFRIKKKIPSLNERERMAIIKKCPLVDKVVLSGVSNHLPHILKESPEIIALGYDQRAYVRGLRNKLAEQGLDVKIKRMRPFKEKIFKNTILKKRQN